SEEDMADLGGNAGAEGIVAQYSPVLCCDAGLLSKLASSSSHRVLAGLNLAAGEHPLHPLQRIEELAYQASPLLVRQSDDGGLVTWIHDSIDAWLPIGAQDGVLGNGEPRIAVYLACTKSAPGTAAGVE